MYEDPVAQSYDSYDLHQFQPHLRNHTAASSFLDSHNQQHNTEQQEQQQTPYPQDSDDQALSRLHQHQLLIQLRLEVNALKNQISQLELLKQQLVQQQSMMSETEYAQMMDQFSRTSVSLLTVGQPTSHFGDQCQIGGGGGGGGSMGGGIGMPMMERLQEKLRSMTIQQHNQNQIQLQHQQQQQSLQSNNSLEFGSDPVTAAPARKDPVCMEQLNIEEELRDLERRMRSIQLIR